jgi:hypothetical protein
MTGGELYLDLMKKVLTNQIYVHEAAPLWGSTVPDSAGASAAADLSISTHTMIGLEGLDNVQRCVEQVLADGVPGDLIETGVWRGGVCIFMRAILAAHGVTDRRVWVADSFQGVPEAGEDSYFLDQEMALHNINSVLSVSADVVRADFKSFDLFDEQVQFLEGWFSDTLPTAPISSLAVLRLDADLYSSTKEALTELYPKLSPGGFLIIDDYNIEPCRTAVHNYRDAHGIDEEMHQINDCGVYWRRSK